MEGGRSSHWSTMRDLAVELFFRRSMGEAAVAEAPEVAVAFRADVPEFVDHSVELFPERQVQEAGQIEIEDVEHFLAVVVFDFLHSPFPPPADGVDPAAWKAERREGGVHSRPGAGSGLRKAHGHPAHIDVFERFQPGYDVFAQQADVMGEIETVYHGWVLLQFV